MNPENPPPKKYWYAPYEGYEARSQHHLKNDLGVDEATAEALLRLRKQVLELQAHVRQLETELEAKFENKQARLARYRKVYYEAIWIELEFQE
jgi:hypothetical protein